MTVENFTETIRAKFQTCLDINVFAQGETAEVITADQSAKFGILILEPHYRTTGKDNAQMRITVIYKTDFLAPTWLFEDLVNKQHLTAGTHELAGKLVQRMTLKIKMVHIDIETTTVAHAKMFTGVLKQECGFSHSPAALDSYQTVAPIDLIHQRAPYGGTQVLQ